MTASISRVQESLAAALMGVSQRLDRLAAQQDEIVSRRRRNIQKMAIQWIPDLSATTARELFTTTPDLDTPGIRKLFGTGKFLGVFETARYRAALDQARIALAAHLDNHLNQAASMGLAANAAEQVAAIERERAVLQSSRATIQELLGRAQAAERAGVKELPSAALPAALIHAVESSAPSSSTQGRRPSYGSKSKSLTSYARTPNAFATSPPPAPDDADIWLYYLTDVPTSGRTLLWSALRDHQSDPVSMTLAPSAAPSPLPTFDNGSSSAQADLDSPAPPGQASSAAAAWGAMDLGSAAAQSAADGANAPSVDFGSAPNNGGNDGWGESPSAPAMDLPSFDTGACASADVLGSFS